MYKTEHICSFYQILGKVSLTQKIYIVHQATYQGHFSSYCVVILQHGIHEVLKRLYGMKEKGRLC